MSQVSHSSPGAAKEPPAFREARDLLLELEHDYHGARAAFVWPRPERFNWALDWFDAELAKGEHGARPALKILGDGVETLELRRAVARLVAPRQRPARARRQARRSAAADARQRRALVGRDAGGDEARPGA